MILGPADANHFRVKVGRYGDRWYTDPLPADDIAPAIDGDEAWPSFSTIKKAAGADWSFVAMKRIANADTAELERLPTLDPAQRYDTCKSINGHGLNVAAGRGTILHWWGEDMLHGREPRQVTDLDLMTHKLPKESLERALRYLPAFQQFFDTYQPTLVATEYVAIHRTLNGVGYGCTPDGLWVIGGDVYAYDFKSRTEDGDHAAYPEEGAQIAAGVRAEYMVIEGPNGAQRAPLPTVAGGMVVSIKPDGVRIYPVDIDAGFTHFTAMHAWWVARRSERVSLGRPWPVRKVAVSADPSADDQQIEADEALVYDQVVTRVRRLVDAGHGEQLTKAWPAGVPGFKGTTHVHTDAELAAIAAACLTVEGPSDLPFTAADQTLETKPPWVAVDKLPAVPEFDVDDEDLMGPHGDDAIEHSQVIDEGPEVYFATYTALRDRFRALDPGHLERLGQITAEAAAAHLPIAVSALRSQRRWTIATALVIWCEVGWDGDVIRDLLASILDSDIPRHPATPLGAVIGALTIAEAERFRDMAQAVADGAVLNHTDRWTLVPA